MVHVMLFPMLKCFVPLQEEFSHKCALPNMAACFSSLVCFPGRLLRYFLNDSELIPVAPGITFLFALYMQGTFNVRSSISESSVAKFALVGSIIL